MKKQNYTISEKYKGPKSFKISRQSIMNSEIKNTYEWIIKRM